MYAMSCGIQSENPVPVEPVKQKPAKKNTSQKSEKCLSTDSVNISVISKLDICVGVIKTVKKHPDADTLYVEEIDVGEELPRTVVSGLVKFMQPEDMLGKKILVLKNLKPVAMRGIKSHAMVLCASNEDHSKVEFLVPPSSCKPGDAVFFPGHEPSPEPMLNPKKKVWETCQPEFTTRDDLVAVWNGIEFTTSSGVVKAPSISKASIK